MMQAFDSDIQIDLPEYATFRKFDDHATHGIGWLKKVDFIIEEPRRYIFVEVKNFDNPAAPEERKAAGADAFRRGSIDQDLSGKFVDSHFYEKAMGRANKPIDYVVLAEATILDGRQYENRTRALRDRLPPDGPKIDGIYRPWANPFVKSVLVLNIEKWNLYLPAYPACLIPPQSAPP